MDRASIGGMGAGPGRVPRWAAYVAAVLASGYSAVSLYWALGGTAGLRSIGGYAERLARTGGVEAVVVIWATVVVKVAGAALAMSLVQPWGQRIPRRLRLWLAGAGAFLLVAYGGAQVAGGVLVETGAFRPPGGVDWTAIRWHLGVWDLWFLLWGIALGVAAAGFRRSGQA